MATPEVTVFSGERANGRLFIADSHIYSSSRRTADVVNLRCHSIRGCPGTAVYCEGDTFIRTLVDHSHPPDRDEEEKYLFRQSLRDGATLTTLEVDAIVVPLSQRYPLGASIFSASEVRTIIRRAREGVPPPPTNMAALITTLEDPKWNSFTLMALTRDRKFYVGPIEVPQGKSIVFRSQTFHLPEAPDIFITFSPIAPRHPATLGKVLLVGFFSQGDHGKVLDVPLIYVWLEDASYLNVLNALRALNLGFLPNSVVVDAQSSLRTAARTVWPFATVSSSLMFFTLAMFQEMESLRIAPIGDRCFTTLRKLVSLTALPHRFIQEGFNLLRTQTEGTMFTPLLHRVQNVWIDGIGVENLSCNDIQDGYDTALTQLLSALAKEMTTGHPRPTAWQ